MKDDVWYDIYFLIDPFIKKVFYVGVAEDYVQRYLQHIQMRDDNEHKNERVAAIRKHGSLPVVYRAMQVYGGDAALFYEALYTDVFIRCNQPITNRDLKLKHQEKGYMKLRDMLVSSYKRNGVDLDCYSFFLGMFTPEMLDSPRAIKKSRKMQQEADAWQEAFAKQNGFKVTVAEYTDIYGTHRVSRIRRIAKKQDSAEEGA